MLVVNLVVTYRKPFVRFSGNMFSGVVDKMLI